MTVADRAAAVVARWVAYYTRRLPAEVAGRRRAELASDLWEQRAEGSAPGRTALSMLWRMAAGALSDLTWRREQLALARRRAGEPAGRTGWAALASGWWLGSPPWWASPRSSGGSARSPPRPPSRGRWATAWPPRPVGWWCWAVSPPGGAPGGR